MDRVARYGRRMDHAWAVQQLREYLGKIDALRAIERAEGEEYDDLVSSHGSGSDVVDQLVTLTPIMKELMEAARPALGKFTEYPSGGWSLDDSRYWHEFVRPQVLRAIGHLVLLVSAGCCCHPCQRINWVS